MKTTITQKNQLLKLLFAILLLPMTLKAGPASDDSIKKHTPGKNVIRYNLSGGMLFGWDKYIVFGYERVLWKNQSVSINAGVVALPKAFDLTTRFYVITKDWENTGYNFSLDYRFYPLKENKHPAPRGLYIGPFFSFNKYHRETRWTLRNSTNASELTATSDLRVSTVGFELGYQFILWKRISLDLVMIGPGWGFYNYQAKFNVNLSFEEREDLYDGLEQIITERFPGANFVFADKGLSADGVMKTSAMGFRYLIHIGFNF